MKQSSSKIDEVIQVVRNNKTERDYFFHKLGSSDDPAKWLKPLIKDGYFKPENNPEPIKTESGGYYMASWNIFEFLFNLLAKNRIKKNEEVTLFLLSFIDEVIKHKNDKNEHVDNHYTHYNLLKLIFSLPPDVIKLEHINYIQRVLHSRWDITIYADIFKETVIPCLLQSGQKQFLLKVIEYLLEYKKKTVISSDEYESIIDDYWLAEILSEHREAIANLVPTECSDIVEKIINKIIVKDESQFNIIWIRHIFDDEQNQFHERYEFQLIMFFRECLVVEKTEALRKRLIKYLYKKHPIFKRVAIFIITQRYHELKTIFWNVKTNPLNFKHVKNELYRFFEVKSSEFNSLEIDMLIDWIEKKDFNYYKTPNNTKEVIDGWKAYEKKEWLYSLRDTKSEKVHSLFKKYETINPSPLNHPGYDYWMSSVSFVSEENSSEIQNYYKMGIDEFINVIKKSKTGQKRIEFPLYEKLGDFLYNYVIKKYDLVSKNLSKFNKLSHYYHYQIIRGIRKLWRDNQPVDWSNTLVYINSIIPTDTVNICHNANEIDHKDWLYGEIAELIEDGVKNDNHAFNINYLQTAKEILIKLENNVLINDKESSETYHNQATKVLNSTKGKIYAALVNISLRNARVLFKEENNKFDTDIKELFEKRLRQDNTEIDFYHSLGKFLPYLLYLDAFWLEKNINLIFPKNKIEAWASAMNGHLFYLSGVYEKLYLLLRENCHLLKALKYDFGDKEVNSRIVHYVGISYINGKEEYTNGGLIKWVIDEGSLEQIESLIRFISIRKDEIHTKDQVKAIVELFKKIYRSIQKRFNDSECHKLYGELAGWLSFFEKLNREVSKIFQNIVQYSSSGHKTSKVIEELKRLVSNSPKYSANILLNLLQKDVGYLYFKEESMKELIEILAQKDEPKAREICNVLIHKKYYKYREFANNLGK